MLFLGFRMMYVSFSKLLITYICIKKETFKKNQMYMEQAGQHNRLILRLWHRHPIGHWFHSRLIHFQSSSLLTAWKSRGVNGQGVGHLCAFRRPKTNSWLSVSDQLSFSHCSHLWPLCVHACMSVCVAFKK